jgi:hypothetical protein
MHLSMSHLARDFARQPPEGSTREADYKVRALAVSLSRSLRVATSSIIAGTGDYRCRRPGRGGHGTHAYTGKSSAVIFSAKDPLKVLGKGYITKGALVPTTLAPTPRVSD